MIFLHSFGTRKKENRVVNLMPFNVVSILFSIRITKTVVDTCNFFTFSSLKRFLECSKIMYNQSVTQSQKAAYVQKKNQPKPKIPTQ